MSCCVGVAAEWTEAPGRVPEGVKPRYCGQMDAKGNKVIKEEEAERRVKAIEAEASSQDGWMSRSVVVGMSVESGGVEQRSPRGPCGLCFLFFRFLDSRVMFICFLFRVEVEVILNY